LQHHVTIDDRKCKKTRKYFYDCFVGSDAVDVLMGFNIFQTRYQALQVGRLLQTKLELFECINSPKVYQLEDDKRLFYEFKNSAAAGAAAGGIGGLDSKHTEALMLHLDEKMRTFQRGVRLKDRSLRLTTYKNCFVGKEAVDLMMRYKMGITRQECVEIGRLLQKRYNLFVPMTGDHEFEDEYVF